MLSNTRTAFTLESLFGVTRGAGPASDTPEGPDARQPVHPCPLYMFGSRHAELFRKGRAR